MAQNRVSLGVLGAGAAARALLAGIIGAGLFRPDQVLVVNRDNVQRPEQLAAELGVRIGQWPAELAGARTILIATKPAAVAEALSTLRLGRSQLVISVAAGIPTRYLEQCLGPSVPVVRAMPNLCCQVRAAVTVIAPGARARPRHLVAARSLFGAVGEVLELPEAMLDAVTATSGSGPAYVALWCEILAQAGVELGLPPEVARRLARLTVAGTGQLLAQGWDPAAIRHGVSSPGGATVAALSVLEQLGCREALTAAVTRAALRSAELAHGLLAPDLGRAVSEGPD